jgi:glycosyltransferase involved in cell wall biosynthesis
MGLRRSKQHRSSRHLLAIVENVPFGSDHRLRKQVESLLAHGYRVTVVTRRDATNRPHRSTAGLRLLEYAGPPEARGRLGYLREYGGSFLSAARLAVSVCLRDRVDVVQFCQPPDLYFPLAWSLRALRCKALIDQRDLMPELYAARFGSHPASLDRLFDVLARWNHRSAHEVLCVNGYLERHAVATGAAPDRVTIVRNGPVMSRIEDAIPDPSLKRGASFLCCWVGMMGRQDRLDLLIETLDLLIRRHGRTDLHLAILGDGESREDARAIVARLGLEPWVTFTGWVSEDVVFRYLATADLGVDASLQAEVSPVKIMEYMGAGLPVAAFDLPETRETVGPEAALAPPGDVPALAELVAALMDDPEGRRAIVERGRARVAADLAWERQASAYVAVVDRLAREVRRDIRTLDRMPA